MTLVDNKIAWLLPAKGVIAGSKKGGWAVVEEVRP